MTLSYDLDPVKIGYTAGILDGEGCVHLGPAGGDYRLQIILASIHRPALEQLQSWWGGNIYETANHKRKEGWQFCWQWHVSSRDGQLQMLEAVLPYLVIKRRASEIAVRFLAVPRGRGKDPETLFRRRELFLEMRSLPREEAPEPSPQLDLDLLEVGA